MKVLPMHQPHAALIAMGLKRVETRPKPTPHSMKGRVAIHANKTDEWMHLAFHDPFLTALMRWNGELPFGHIIGTVVIVRSVTITAEVSAWQKKHKPVEYAFGDYTPGRFGWVLRDPIALAPGDRIPFRGHQGWPTIDDEEIPEYAR